MFNRNHRSGLIYCSFWRTGCPLPLRTQYLRLRAREAKAVTLPVSGHHLLFLLGPDRDELA